MVMNRALPIIIGMLMAFSMVIASFADTWSRDSYFILSYLSVIVTIWLVFSERYHFSVTVQPCLLLPHFCCLASPGLRGHF